MAGLENRLRSHYRAQAALAEDVRVQETQLRREIRDSSKKTAADSVRLQAEERARVLPALTPLLQTLGVIGQLQELRRLWKTGEVDATPFVGQVKVPDSKIVSFPGSNINHWLDSNYAGLAYSYDFWELHYAKKKIPHYEGPITRYVPRVEKVSNKCAVLVQKDPTIRFRLVWMNDFPDDTSIAFHDHEKQQKAWHEFDAENPNHARVLLEELIFEKFIQSETPKEVKRKARQKIFSPQTRFDPKFQHERLERKNIPIGAYFQGI